MSRNAPIWRPASFFEQRGSLRVCTLCPFHCAPPPGMAGRCGMRRNGQQGWESAAFLTATRLWQPVERKPFHHVHPGRDVLTLAAPGCTFRCDYCENAELAQVDSPEQAPCTLFPLHPEAVVEEAARRHGLLAFSYSEPTLSAEIFLAVAAAAQPAGVGLLWKSNGFISLTALARVAPHLLAINIDLKSMDPLAHQQLTGAPLSPVLAAMAGFASQGVWVEISTPLIPGFNDHPPSVRAMARQVASLGAETPWHLLRFHPDHRRATTPPTPPTRLEEARQWALASGLHHVYTHHGADPGGLDTRCPACALSVVRRNHAQGLVETILSHGACPRCQTPVAGRWKTASKSAALAARGGATNTR